MQGEQRSEALIRILSVAERRTAKACRCQGGSAFRRDSRGGSDASTSAARNAKQQPRLTAEAVPGNLSQSATVRDSWPVWSACALKVNSASASSAVTADRRTAFIT